MYPDKPSNLRITNKTSRTVTFSWISSNGRRGRRTYTLPNQDYSRCECYSDYTLVKAHTSSTATNLIPNTDYMMSIVAQNNMVLVMQLILNLLQTRTVREQPFLGYRLFFLLSIFHTCRSSVKATNYGTIVTNLPLTNLEYTTNNE